MLALGRRSAPQAIINDHLWPCLAVVTWLTAHGHSKKTDVLNVAWVPACKLCWTV